MASLFSSNKILPNLKRRARPSIKSDASPAKAKPLHILPNVAEEDESSNRSSCSSSSSLPTNTNLLPSRHVGGCVTLGARPTHDKRDSRRVVLTGVEGLTFDDFFPASSAPRTRTPSPPPRARTVSPLPRPQTPPRSAAPPSSASSESSLDDINLRFSGLGISLDFPSPPSSAATFSALSRRREQSPSPSVTSSDCTSSPKTPCSTPPTSDDEQSPFRSHLMRAPTYKSQHASVLFMQSMPDLAEPVRKSSIVSLAETDVSEDVDWIAQDVSDIVTLSSPLPAAFREAEPEPTQDARARPDSMPPPPRSKRNRDSKMPPPLPRISIQDVRGPSAQLDPTFPVKRRSYMVPSRPPPPPPVQSSAMSAMEQATEDLLAELANAALGAGFLGTELTIPYDATQSPASLPPTPSSHFIVVSPTASVDSSARPPPRFASVPADVDFSSEVESPIELLTPTRPHSLWPTTPMSASVYSQLSGSETPSSPLSSFDFDIEPAPESPALSRTTSQSSLDAAERTLRSRWSTSTLGSLAESHSHSWLPRFTLSPSKRGKGKAPASSPSPPPSHSHASSVALNASTNSPLQRKNAVKGGGKRSLDSERGFSVGASVSRRDSRSSHHSSASDSGESTTSTGLARKPIPMALLAMSGAQNAMSM